MGLMATPACARFGGGEETEEEEEEEDGEAGRVGGEWLASGTDVDVDLDVDPDRTMQQQQQQRPSETWEVVMDDDEILEEQYPGSVQSKMRLGPAGSGPGSNQVLQVNEFGVSGFRLALTAHPPYQRLLGV